MKVQRIIRERRARMWRKAFPAVANMFWLSIALALLWAAGWFRSLPA